MSTYSNLKIELMATGANTTTWGNVTNINIGAALGAAIASSVNIAFTTADRTLTWTDTNGPQDARYVRLNLTGTPASDYNLIVPIIAEGKPYIVNNGTGRTITVKTPLGTGIAVPTGKTMWVYSDGTNVVDAVTHLTSLTLASPLAIASGGTGGNTAANARTALELGTIATQNSSNVTITGGNVTGITDLAVADGGTGASTNSAARVNLLPSYTNNNSKILALNAGGTDVEWIAAGGAGTVTNVTGVGTVNGISLSGSVTTSGNVTLGGALTGVNLSTQVTGVLPILNGGTGSNSASGARTALGLGSLATLSSINNANWSGTVLAIANGGTGTNTAASALSALGGLGVTGSELTSQGYIELSNGLHIIWGSFSAAGNSATTYNYTTTNASISLSTFSVAVVSGGPSSGGDNMPHVTGCNTTGFTVYNDFTSSVTTFFVAVGV